MINLAVIIYLGVHLYAGSLGKDGGYTKTGFALTDTKGK